RFDLVGADPAQARHAVGAPAPLELVEALELGAVGRDDHLPAALGDDAAPLAILIQVGGPFDAQARLQRAGHVVDAGVDHTRVVPGLVGPELSLALEHADRSVRPAREQLAGDRQAQDAPADD